MSDAVLKTHMDKAMIADTIRCAAPEAMDGLAKFVNSLAGRTGWPDDDVQELLELLQACRRGQGSVPRGGGRPHWSRLYPARRRQPRPGQAELNRRRRQAARARLMPPQITAHFTEGEAAALMIVADQIRTRGACDLYLDQIAALAGVSRSTVKNAIRHARRLELLAVQLRPVKGRGKKSQTNVITMTSAEWKGWISLRKGRVVESCPDNRLIPMMRNKQDSLSGGRLTLPEAVYREPSAPRAEGFLQ